MSETTICPSCLASPGQGHDPDCNADRRPRENGVLVCSCEYSAMFKKKLEARLSCEAAALSALERIENVAGEGAQIAHSIRQMFRQLLEPIRAALSSAEQPWTPVEQALPKEDVPVWIHLADTRWGTAGAVECAVYFHHQDLWLGWPMYDKIDVQHRRISSWKPRYIEPAPTPPKPEPATKEE